MYTHELRILVSIRPIRRVRSDIPPTCTTVGGSVTVVQYRNEVIDPIGILSAATGYSFVLMDENACLIEQ